MIPAPLGRSQVNNGIKCESHYRISSVMFFPLLTRLSGVQRKGQATTNLELRWWNRVRPAGDDRYPRFFFF